MLQRFREPINGLSHLGAAVVAAFGLAYLLVRGQGDLPKMASLLVYGVSLVLMFSASAAYHLVNGRPEVIRNLRIFDHTAIYLLIAGTYTPICIIFLTGFWGRGFLAIIWSIALLGIISKVFIVRAPRWLSAGLYLLMGWLALLGIQELIGAIPAGGLVWLAAGGLFYSAGAIIYILKWPDLVPGVFGFHELWHIFVILGAFSHYVLVAVYAAPLA